MHHIDPSTINIGAFMERVELSSNGCWLWNGARDKGDYGSITINGVSLLAHRVSYTLFRGRIRDGLFICHDCDNPPCVNPSHLFQGTQAENLMGHFSPEQKSTILEALKTG